MSKTKMCSECGAEFECGPTETGAECWCSSLPKVMPFPPGGDCLCPNCLKHKIGEIESKKAGFNTLPALPE